MLGIVTELVQVSGLLREAVLEENELYISNISFAVLHSTAFYINSKLHL
jgi:hypothetical protein